MHHHQVAADGAPFALPSSPALQGFVVYFDRLIDQDRFDRATIGA
jgi:hypothetical protein